MILGSATQPMYETEREGRGLTECVHYNDHHDHVHRLLLQLMTIRLCRAYKICGEIVLSKRGEGMRGGERGVSQEIYLGSIYLHLSIHHKQGQHVFHLYIYQTVGIIISFYYYCYYHHYHHLRCCVVPGVGGGGEGQLPLAAVVVFPSLKYTIISQSVGSIEDGYQTMLCYYYDSGNHHHQRRGGVRPCQSTIKTAFLLLLALVIVIIGMSFLLYDDGLSSVNSMCQEHAAMPNAHLFHSLTYYKLTIKTQNHN